LRRRKFYEGTSDNIFFAAAFGKLGRGPEHNAEQHTAVRFGPGSKHTERTDRQQLSDIHTQRSARTDSGNSRSNFTGSYNSQSRHDRSSSGHRNSNNSGSGNWGSVDGTRNKR